LDEITRLALLTRDGDRSAAGDFVRATQADVWRQCAHLGNRDQADDLTQETYLRAFGALHRFAGRSSARTWLLSIARRVCADAVRGAVRERAGNASLAAVPPERSPDHSESIAWSLLLAELPDRLRDPFVLTQLLGLSYAEVADICGWPIGTVRSRVARARDHLVRMAEPGSSRRGDTRAV
jgi:RNA polymerase sigma-70 factor (ECF subfamily)